MANKPDQCTEEHLVFLDELRESGVTNMFGAAPYLQREYGCPKIDADEIVQYWMQTFEERNPIK